MLILFQNGTRVCNLDNIKMIRIEEYKDTYMIRFNDGIIDCVMGVYKTEERAKQILRQIMEYNSFIKKRMVYAMADSSWTFEENYYFEMPEQ